MKRLLLVVLSSILVLSISVVGGQEVSAEGEQLTEFLPAVNLTPDDPDHYDGLTGLEFVTPSGVTVSAGAQHFDSTLHTGFLNGLFDMDLSTFWIASSAIDSGGMNSIQFEWEDAKWLEKIQLLSASIDGWASPHRFLVEFKMGDGVWLTQSYHWTDDGHFNGSNQSRNIHFDNYSPAKHPSGIFGVRLTFHNNDTYIYYPASTPRLGGVNIFAGDVENPEVYDGSSGYWDINDMFTPANEHYPTDYYEYNNDLYSGAWWTVDFGNGVKAHAPSQDNENGHYFAEIWDSYANMFFNEAWRTGIPLVDDEWYPIIFDWRDAGPKRIEYIEIQTDYGDPKSGPEYVGIEYLVYVESCGGWVWRDSSELPDGDNSGAWTWSLGKWTQRRGWKTIEIYYNFNVYGMRLFIPNNTEWHSYNRSPRISAIKIHGTSWVE